MLDAAFTNTFGWTVGAPNHVKEYVGAAGFTNIHERQTHVPLGRWHRDAKMREIGMFAQTLTEDFTHAIMAKHETLGLTEEEANKFEQETFDIFNDTRIHAQIPYLDVWAQKPAA